MTMTRIGSPNPPSGDVAYRLYVGSVVVMLTASNYNRLWTVDEFDAAFDTDLASGYKHTVILTMNGDTKVQGLALAGVAVDTRDGDTYSGVWQRFATTPTAGNVRINYLVIVPG